MVISLLRFVSFVGHRTVDSWWIRRPLHLSEHWIFGRLVGIDPLAEPLSFFSSTGSRQQLVSLFSFAPTTNNQRMSSGLGGLNKSKHGVVIGLVQLQLPVVKTPDDLAKETSSLTTPLSPPSIHGVGLVGRHHRRTLSTTTDRHAGSQRAKNAPVFVGRYHGQYGSEKYRRCVKSTVINEA